MRTAALVVGTLGLLAGGAWAAIGPDRPAVAAARAQEDPREGRLVFFRHCRACHSATGAETSAPDLRGLLDPEAESSLALDSVRSIVRRGRGAMRGFGDELSEEELDDLMAYLESL